MGVAEIGRWGAGQGERTCLMLAASAGCPGLSLQSRLHVTRLIDGGGHDSERTPVSEAASGGLRTAKLQCCSQLGVQSSQLAETEDLHRGTPSLMRKLKF